MCVPNASGEAHDATAAARRDIRRRQKMQGTPATYALKMKHEVRHLWRSYWLELWDVTVADVEHLQALVRAQNQILRECASQ